MRGSFDRENNEMAIKILELQSELAQANLQLAIKNRVIEDLNYRLDERRTSPNNRKRERERYSRYEHETDIYVGGWNDAKINFEAFKEFLSEKYGIEVLKVSGTEKDQFFSRLHMKSKEDQKALLNNVEEIRNDFGLTGVIKVFEERKYNRE